MTECMANLFVRISPSEFTAWAYHRPQRSLSRQQGSSKSHQQQFAWATGSGQEGRICLTWAWAEELELSGAEQKELISLAVTGIAKPLLALEGLSEPRLSLAFQCKHDFHE